MAAYRDSAAWGTPEEPRGHLIADSLDELHAVAAQLGLTNKHFMAGCLTPHYQLPERLQADANVIGVIFLNQPAFMRKVGQVSDALSAADRRSPRSDRHFVRRKPKPGETASLF